ncbi:MAG TPA: hypothetical protein VLC92_05670 [Rhodocyclaceae bacterium]|nr:hypothetical protein [Rhodocyclaceae bacterium]
MIAVPLAAASLAVSPIAKAVAALYGMGVAIDNYLDKHIDMMKGSESPTVSRTGAILEMAKYGFGLGYLTSVVVIATGQFILGNTLSALTTVATAATLTNPIAMTCAAVGAIYYGWGALSYAERNTILEKLGKGLEIGIELIKAVINFVVDTTKKLLSSKNFEELKNYVSSAAATFGKTLSDVTHRLGDVVTDTVGIVLKKGSEAIDGTVELAADAYTAVKDTIDKTADGTAKHLSEAEVARTKIWGGKTSSRK